VFLNLKDANKVCEELNTCYKHNYFSYFIQDIPLALDATLKQDYEPNSAFPFYIDSTSLQSPA
jgi:hypothetical protein